MTPTGPQPVVHSITLSPHLAEVSRGRALIAEIASQAGFPEERVFDITVACSEAIANAIEHSPVKGEVQVRAIVRSDRLEIEVQGPGAFQAPERLKSRESRGLGLPLMARLSDHLALFSGPKGETFVSLTFYCPGVEIQSGNPIAPSFVNLAEENRLLDDILKNFPEGFYVLDDDWRFVYLNPAMAAAMGKAADGLLGAVLWEAFPDYDPEARATLERVKTDRSPATTVTKYDQGFWRERTAFPVGEGIAVISRDITDRERAEERLKEREAQLRLVLDNSLDGINLLDLRTGKYTIMNPAQAESTGFTMEEMNGAGAEEAYERVHPDDREISMEQQRRVAAGEDVNEPVEYRWMVKSGEYRWFSDRRKLVRDEQGNPVALVGVSRDITGHKEAEAALARERDLVQAVLDSAGRAHLVYLDRDFNFVRVNETYAATCGYRPDQMIGKNHFVLYPNAEIEAIFQRVRDTGEPFEISDKPFEFPDQPERGMTYWDWTLIPVKDDDGEATGLILSLFETTARKRAEEALRESEERYRSIAKENECLYRQQLDIAETLQLALLHIPSEIGPLKVGHLYRSATEAARVGGDFYDIFETKGGGVALLVGDVAGHGIQAARTATLVKDVVHAFAHQTVLPHEVIRRTNELLVEKDLPGFVTLFLGILDTQTGTLRYVSAGHPETLLRRASGDIQLLGCGSKPVGMYPEASWKPGSVELEPGDLLLLYTDGVLESRCDGEFFGLERLVSVLKRKRLSVERLPHMVLDKVLAFSGGRLNDDVAVLAVSLTAKSHE